MPKRNGIMSCRSSSGWSCGRSGVCRQRLEGADWIHIFERPSDLRQKMLVLSAKGYKVCVSFEKVLRRVLKNIEVRDGDDPIETTRRLTALLAQRLQNT